MELQEALKFVGAVICKFEPSEDDECETCGKPNKQLYYRRTCYEVDEGEYYCEDCIKLMPEQWKKEAESFGVRIDEITKNNVGDVGKL